LLIKKGDSSTLCLSLGLFYKLRELLNIVVSVDASALKIHLSALAQSAITAFPEFITECRGEIPVKVEYN